ncbi:MAG: DUF2834 domain-containing protein, partial [Chloroflexota bacterium]
MQRTILIIVTILFGALTAAALWFDGVIGIFSSIFTSWGSAQIYVDLVIACGILCVWMYRDSKQIGRNPWPWIILTAIAGVFGPLGYLLTR